MRSCSSGAMRFRSASVRAERTASSTTRPRSIRCTGKAHSFAMSVAFEAHGEIVPSRGTTYRRCQSRGGGAGPPP